LLKNNSPHNIKLPPPFKNAHEFKSKQYIYKTIENKKTGWKNNSTPKINHPSFKNAHEFKSKLYIYKIMMKTIENKEQVGK